MRLNNRGFALLEIIVSIGIFAVIFIIVMNIFQSVITGQRNAIASEYTQDTMRYIFEMMSKEIRAESGGAYSQTVPDELLFTNKNGDSVRYFLSNERLWVSRNGVDLPITPNQVKISGLQFVISGGATEQSKVTIKIDIEMSQGKDINKQKIKMQTTISSRNYE
jgi:prepilin-type N-terminal cleavage/methylation domain-containing protein